MSSFLSPQTPWFGPLLAFALSLLVSGGVRLAGMRALGGRMTALAGCGVGFGFLAAWVAVMDWPALPVHSLRGQVIWVALSGLAAGLAMDLLRLRRRWAVAALTLFALLAVWGAFGWRADWTPSLAWRPALLAAVWLILLLRLESRPAAEPVGAVMLAMAAAGLGMAAALSADPLMARLSWALAAAVAGFFVWNWAGLPLMSAAMLSGGAALLAIGQTLWLTGRVSGWVLLVLVLTLFADGTAGMIPAGSGRLRRLARPPILALVCLLPVGVAAAIAYVAAHPLR